MIARVSFYSLIITFAGLLLLSNGAFAERPENTGGGGDKIVPPDYGDIVILYRDTRGVPELTDAVHADAEDEYSEIIGGLCRQPILSPQYFIINPGCLMTNPEVSGEDAQCLAEVDPETCVPLPEYSLYLQEVDFGRISLARSPDQVFDAQLDEAVFNLTTAGCTSLDPTGRMVYSSLIDGEVVSHTIDSPLQNLAIYRKLMTDGELHDSLSLEGGWMVTAAVALGAASDKEGEVTVDLVSYLNMIFGFTADGAPSALDTICIDVREEVKGKIEVNQKCYLDYGSYIYNRDDNFMSLPSPPYIPSDAPKDGTFEYMMVTETDPYTTVQTVDTMLNVVPELADTWVGDNIKAFAKTADDTRAVIEFMHTYEVAEDYATPLNCTSEPDMYYDVSISEKSGLQVPRRMVAGTEGREGVVTIQNSGPAVASGAVKLIGTTEEGDIVGSLYRMVDNVSTGEEIFIDDNNYQEQFVDLSAGMSVSWTFYFSMDFQTTITWKAEIIAVDDVNDDNDSVEKITIVTEPKGGGGH